MRGHRLLRKGRIQIPGRRNCPGGLRVGRSKPGSGVEIYGLLHVVDHCSMKSKQNLLARKLVSSGHCSAPTALLPHLCLRTLRERERASRSAWTAPQKGNVTGHRERHARSSRLQVIGPTMFSRKFHQPKSFEKLQRSWATMSKQAS